MSGTILENSSATYEPLINRETGSISFTAQSNIETLSSAVTPSGRLRDIASAYTQNDKLSLTRCYENFIASNGKKIQKHLALIRLLDSWDEEDVDEEDQRGTWEHLKRALDEDRLSDRKLFP